MKKRVIATILAASVIAPAAVSLTGCKKKVADDENTLQIFVSDFGYGTDWVNDMIAAFKEQDWVKEKYPQLNIPKPDKNSERTFPADRMITDGKTNTYDLLFACDSAVANYDKTDGNGNPYFEDLTELYQTQIPGESVTFAEKLDGNIRANMQYTGRDNSKKYYSVQWVNGYMGLLYNQTYVTQYLGADYELPRTTIELEAMAKEIKGENIKNVAPFISSTKAGYWNQVCYTWWVQYEGTARYEDYWLGVDKYDQITNENFSQTGRLRSLETLESLIGKEKGYNHEEVNTLEFTSAQSKYLLGEAFMMPNGDWFENEMRSNYAEDKNHYDIRFMQMPVISSIVENMEFYKDTYKKPYSELTAAEKQSCDDILSKIVAAVDAEKTYETAKESVPDLTEKDYAKITEARHVVYSVEGHEGYIPAYATGKAIAKDFLLFMATDKGIETFMKATNGASTAFRYDVETKSPDLYNGFSNLQKSRASITKNGVVPFCVTSSSLVYWGGLTYYSISNALEPFFTAQNDSDRKTAKQIFDNDVNYYTKNDGEYWKELLSRAGIQN